MPNSDSSHKNRELLILLAGLLLTTFGGIIGFLFSSAFDLLNLQARRDEFEHSQSVDLVGQRIDESQLALALLPLLTGDDEAEKRAAIIMTGYSLSGLGPGLLELAESTSQSVEAPPASPSVSVEVQSALSVQRRQLSDNLFSESYDTRSAALSSIQLRWKDDSGIASTIARAVLDRDSESSWPISNGQPNEWLFVNGRYNSFLALDSLSAPALEANRNEVCEVIASVSDDHPKTKALAESIQMKLAACSVR